MRAVITVAGKDRVGIMSLVCALLAQHNVNILDISQTILQEDFTMVMLVDAGACDIPFGQLAALLEQEVIDQQPGDPPLLRTGRVRRKEEPC